MTLINSVTMATIRCAALSDRGKYISRGFKVNVCLFSHPSDLITCLEKGEHFSEAEFRYSRLQLSGGMVLSMSVSHIPILHLQ